MDQEKKRILKDAAIDIASYSVAGCSGLIVGGFSYALGNSIMPIPNDKVRHTIAYLGAVGVSWAVTDTVYKSAKSTFKPLIHGFNYCYESMDIDELHAEYEDAKTDMDYYAMRMHKLIEKEKNGEKVDPEEYNNVFDIYGVKDEEKEEK